MMLNELIKNKNAYWLLLGFMAVAQVVVPSYMIYTSEKTIEQGEVYNFELGAIDPYDPFRGKYIILNPKENFLTGYSAPCVDCKLYATFFTDDRGLAQINSLSTIVPHQSSYLTIDSFTASTSDMGTAGTVISYPFEKYFMNEHKAKPAEDLIRKMQRDTSIVTYAQVSILNGKAQVLRVMSGEHDIIDLLNRPVE